MTYVCEELELGLFHIPLFFFKSSLAPCPDHVKQRQDCRDEQGCAKGVGYGRFVKRRTHVHTYPFGGTALTGVERPYLYQVHARIQHLDEQDVGSQCIPFLLIVYPVLET